MQTFTLGFGLWLRRLTARNPLIRASDRIEAAAVILIFALACLAAPVAGAAGTAVYDDLNHALAGERSDRHAVEATVTHDSKLSAEAYEKPFLTAIQWHYDGTIHTDEVRTNNMKTGEHMSIWVNNAGVRASAPLTAQDAAAQAVAAALIVWSAVVGAAVAVWALLRARLIRSRYSDWDRELDDLADNGGRTNNNA